MTKLIALWLSTVTLVAALACLNLRVFADDIGEAEPNDSATAGTTDLADGGGDAPDLAGKMLEMGEEDAKRDVEKDGYDLARAYSEGYIKYFNFLNRYAPDNDYDLARAYSEGYIKYLDENKPKNDPTPTDAEDTPSKGDDLGGGNNEATTEEKPHIPLFWILVLGIPLFLAIIAIAMLFVSRKERLEEYNALKKENKGLAEKVRKLEGINKGLKNDKMALSEAAKQKKDDEFQARLNAQVMHTQSAVNRTAIAKMPEEIERQRMEDEVRRNEEARRRREEEYRQLVSVINGINAVSDRLRWQKEIKARFANVQFIRLLANGNYLIDREPTGSGNYLVAVVNVGSKFYVVPFAEDIKRCGNFYESTAYTSKPKIEMLAEISITGNSFTLEKQGRLDSGEEL